MALPMLGMPKSKLKKKTSTLLVLLLVGLLLLINIVLIVTLTKQPAMPSLEGFEKLELSVQPNSLILSQDCLGLRIFVDRDQASSIAAGLAKERGPRPGTHDLFADLLSVARAAITVKITELRNDTFYATLAVGLRGLGLFELDARPSDAIAIAVRLDSPIWTNSSLLKRYGIDLCAQQRPENQSEVLFRA